MLSGRTLSVSLRSTAPPRGGALGKTGRSRPRRSTAGRSQPISGKLFAPAKASPFRERWHGEAVTERVDSRLAAAFGKRLSKSEPGQNRKKRLCLRHTARFCSGDLLFGSRVEPWSCLPRIESSGRFSGSLLACKREHFLSDFMFCQSYNCRKMCFRDEPSQSPTATAPPRGGALGRTSKFHPHSSTAGRSQPINCKLSASAKASPFRERWHGEAVTERVSPRLAAAFGKRLSKSEPGQNRKKRLCRRHTARFCSGDLHFWVQGGTLVVPPAHRK